MANFVIVVDPQPERRTEFISAARTRISPLPGLVIESCNCGAFAAVSARGASVPFSRSIQDDSVAWLFGDALRENDTWVQADQLRDLWSDVSVKRASFDGYFAGIVYDAVKGLTIARDILGLFPLYYYQQGDVLLAGASPELFRLHPCFTSRLSPRGLAGILLVNSLVQEQGLLEGVRQLPVGCALRWSDRGPVQELQTAPLNPTDGFRDRPYGELLEAADEAMERVIRRHAPQGPAAFLLSGGLDSRVVAGFLHRLGHAPPVLSFGRLTDFDVQGAREVARILDWPFHNFDPPTTPEHADRVANLEHLSSGFSYFNIWDQGPIIAEFAGRFWSGFVLDALMGSFLTRAYDPSRQECTWEMTTYSIRRHGLPREGLARLLMPLGGAALVDDAIGGLGAWLRSFPGEGPQPMIHAQIALRLRHHVGASMWRKSFGSWPVLPWLDRQFLETFLAMPPSAVLHRQLERDLLITRFPELARVPLDTNSGSVKPLLPSQSPVWRRLRQAVSLRHRWHDGWRPWARWLERRRYHRLADLNGPAWKAVRNRAEPQRSKLAQWCQPDELDHVLPDPRANCRCENPFTDNAARRNLLGLMLWAENH